MGVVFTNDDGVPHGFGVGATESHLHGQAAKPRSVQPCYFPKT